MLLMAWLDMSEEQAKKACKGWDGAALGFTNRDVVMWMRNAHAQQWNPAVAKAEAKNAAAVQHAAQKTAEAVQQLVQEKAFRMKAAEKLAASEKEWQLTKAGLIREKKALEAEHAAAQGAATQFG